MTKYLDQRWVADGSGILLRRSEISRPGDPPPDTGDPLVPIGYTLTGGKKWDLTVDEGWHRHTGTTICAGYTIPENVTFDANGMHLRCAREATGGRAYSTAEARWGNGVGFMGDEWYMRYVAKMEQPLILGDFPAGPWHRAITLDGNGEIDTYETMANHISGVIVLDGGNGPSKTGLFGNKTTVIKTPYDSNQINYQLGYDEAAIGSTKLNFCETYHTWEVYKTLTDLTTYVDGHLMTHHVRGQGPMSAAVWDSQFAAGKLWDLRISYQYGDYGQNVGSAGRAQPFNGDRFFNIKELLVAVPA